MDFQIISGIPQEISMEILSKFPVKSLLQFKCVSKLWRGFISSPEFMKVHFHSSVNNHPRGMLNTEEEFEECTLRSLFSCLIPEEISTDYPNLGCFCVGSVNGLICVFTTESLEGKDSNKLYLWNPCIKKAKKLPDFYEGINFSIDQSLYGFGYDEVHDDYKVVVVSDFNVDPAKVIIYSLKTDSWKRIDDYKDGLVMDRQCQFVNGKLYWTSCARRSSEYTDWEVVSFDLADETWGKLEQPNYEEGRFDLMPGVLGCDLVVLCNYMTRQSGRPKTDVWIMKNDGVNTSWTKTFTCPISFPKYPEKKNLYPPMYPPNDLKNTGGNLPIFESVMYRMTDRAFEQRLELKELHNSPGIYVESLVNPLLY